MKIEVSNGDILDKMSILVIKFMRISDADKIKNVRSEMISIMTVFTNLVRNDACAVEYIDLLYVNSKLWEIEDEIRVLEKSKDFGERFVELARSVYIMNDERARIKKRINKITNSDIVEEKSYSDYAIKG